MSIFDRFRTLKKVTLNNTEPNTEQEIGVQGVDDNTDCHSVDWHDKLPDLVRPSIINLRKCGATPLVSGILHDFVMKSISGYEIVGDDPEAVAYIKEHEERWDIKSLLFEVSMNNFISGVDFYEKVIIDNELTLRQLAFDGENYRIKELYDDSGTEIIGYQQWVKYNQQTNNGWTGKHFFTSNYSEEYKTVNFLPEQITVPCFFRDQGKPKSIVRGVLDHVYMIELLNQMLPQIVYKQTNTMIATVGNKDVRNLNLSIDEMKTILDNMTNYHEAGAVAVPYGVSVELVGDTVLPKVQEYINVLEKQVYVGLITPEAVFSSSSSNRSTAVVQLDSNKSGRVLMQEFLQNKLNRWIKKEVFNTQLEIGGYSKDTVWLDFNPIQEVEDGLDDEDMNNLNVSPSDGLNINNIRNGDGRLAEVNP
jgi:hypothetical protein